MGARGFNIVEEGQIVTLYVPAEFQGIYAGADSIVIVHMENYSHATIIYSIGVNPLAAGVVTIESCDDLVPTTPTEIMFPYYRYETSQSLANGDVPGALTWTATAAAGLIPVAGAVPQMYVIELDASMLVDGHVGFRMCVVNPGGASTGSAIAILSGARYAKSSTSQMTVY
ncbi:MAG TPA: hypothetical protein VMV74_05930 [Bacteroidales bacterium]|nr:hypothetical protein [Bacteroidales bacterium]